MVVTGFDVTSLPATLRQPRAWLVTAHSQPISPVSVPFAHEGLPCVFSLCLRPELYERYIGSWKEKCVPRLTGSKREKSPSSPQVKGTLQPSWRVGGTFLGWCFICLLSPASPILPIHRAWFSGFGPRHLGGEARRLP